MVSKSKYSFGVSRVIIAAVIALIVVIAAIAGYMALRPPAAPPSPSPSPTTYITAPATPTTQITPAKRIVIGVTDKITDLDPAQAYDFFTWEVMNNIMGGLVTYKPGTTEIVPNLAESWNVSDDGKVWVFKLRKDLRFADGTPCTADNVVWSVKRTMKINGDPAWLVTDFVEDVVALDNYTVKFILKKPVSYFLALLATPHTSQ